MNLIIHESEAVSLHTNLNDVFKGIGFSQDDYMWMISDFETNIEVPLFKDKSEVMIDGETLSKLVLEYDIQFIWGIFSAFKKSSRQLESIVPNIRDNYAYDFVKPQHPNAEFEVYCLDGSATAFVSENEDLLMMFSSFYPEAKAYIKDEKIKF